MKISDLNPLPALAPPSSTERKTSTRARPEPVCDVKLSTMATWLNDLKNETSNEPALRTAEIDRARADIESGAINEDLGAAIDSMLQEI